MLDLHLQYDPNISLTHHMVTGFPDHTVTGNMLTSGLMPDNLVEITTRSVNFRDAVINHVIRHAASEPERQKALELLSAAVASTPTDAEETLRIYSEYTAAFAYAWGETVLATRAVLRNQPNNAGNFLSTIASALNKKMDTAMFNSLIMNSTSNAPAQWEQVEKPLLFPNA